MQQACGKEENHAAAWGTEHLASSHHTLWAVTGILPKAEGPGCVAGVCDIMGEAGEHRGRRLSHTPYLPARRGHTSKGKGTCNGLPPGGDSGKVSRKTETCPPTRTFYQLLVCFWHKEAPSDTARCSLVEGH